MPQTITIESFEEFSRRHGNNYLALGKSGLLAWADGALCRADNADARQEPPDDPRELARLKLAYHRAALKIDETDFNSAKQRFGDAAALAARYNNMPGPPANAVQILEELAESARVHRETIAELEQQLIEKPSPEQLAIQRHQEVLAETRSRAGELLHEIQQVTI